MVDSVGPAVGLEAIVAVGIGVGDGDVVATAV